MLKQQSCLDQRIDAEKACGNSLNVRPPRTETIGAGFLSFLDLFASRGSSMLQLYQSFFHHPIMLSYMLSKMTVHTEGTYLKGIFNSQLLGRCEEPLTEDVQNLICNILPYVQFEGDTCMLPWYYCFLVPLTVPILVVAVYFHWLSMKFFKHA